MSCWLHEARWRRERDDVLAKYPGSRSLLRTIAGHPTRVLHVPMTPVPARDDSAVIFADLDIDRPVGFMPGGMLTHSPSCPVPLDNHERLLPRLRLQPRCYRVQLTYPPRAGNSAGPLHPRARVLAPEISHRTIPMHPHLNRSVDGIDSWVCPIPPHDTGWDWYPGATADYLDQVSIWILKTAVWLLTGGGLLTPARWIGPAASHRAIDILSNPPDAPCPCGRGFEYRTCCRTRHIRIFLRALELSDDLL